MECEEIDTMYVLERTIRPDAYNSAEQWRDRSIQKESYSMTDNNIRIEEEVSK